MRRNSVNRILAKNAPDDFIGREGQLEQLMAHASGPSKGIVVLGTPSAGTTELLRQVYDQTFAAAGDTIPFYFEIRASDITARNSAARFSREFLLATVAFRRRDVKIIDSAPEISEISELAIPADGYWIDRIIETFSNGENIDDERAFVRHGFSGPLRAAANGARSCVIIDNLHLAKKLYGGDGLFEDINEIYSRASIPFILAGRRRALFAQTQFESLDLDTFNFTEAGRCIESLAARTGVAVNDQTRDLIAVQLGGNAGHIVSLFAAASGGKIDLNTFEYVERVYTDELFGGRIGRYFDNIFDTAIPDSTVQSSVIKILTENFTSESRKVPVAYWQRHFSGALIESILGELNDNEIVNVGSGSVETDETNIVVGDYIRGRGRLESAGEPRGHVIGETLSDNIKRAPLLMARQYRRLSALGLSGLLRKFDGREISTALIDYGRFASEFKGADEDKILADLADDADTLTLPNIVYTAHTSAFYPPMNEICDAERSVVALGFAAADGKSESVWIAAEIDSKLEATREVAEFWCDRLEMVALRRDFEQYTIWLIAPEGFDADAVAALRDRGAYGSSRKQAEMLAGLLNAKVSLAVEKADNEYEIVLPMGEDTEMIAAHTVEDIARRHNFPAKAINQIKTAVVEACINASEHSLSPDRKIHQKFSVTGDRLTVTIANRGVRLADKQPAPDPATEQRRGWGLKLIKGLMDEVTFAQTDDGTQITMVKYLPKV